MAVLAYGIDEDVERFYGRVAGRVGIGRVEGVVVELHAVGPGEFGRIPRIGTGEPVGFPPDDGQVVDVQVVVVAHLGNGADDQRIEFLDGSTAEELVGGRLVEVLEFVQFAGIEPEQRQDEAYIKWFSHVSDK
jgi:hypothetical protein